ncbi:T9SS type A sorting domain-containing protein [Emticicia sp. SJ17W-69]|uniref:T9SS type A sorting domain-containing protein n=1 Tax=Emticicia sp. SJ17W-69 TaxID=3421657 RepID=UPI003EB8098D
MKLNSTLFFFLFCLNTILQAQTTQEYAYANFYSPQGSSFLCGGKTIIGQLYQNYYQNGNSASVVYAEDNKFYLEIASVGSKKYTKILAQKVDIGNSGKAQFQLPDTLKAGRTYLLRMSSTNPASITNSDFPIRFGLGNLPFVIDFQQETTYYRDSPKVYLNYSLKLKDKNSSTDSVYQYLYENFQLNVKLSDNANYSANYNFSLYSLPYSSSFAVSPKDSISIYKIDEAINQCGVKGEIIGEAKAVRKNFIDKIIIQSDPNQSTFCKNSKISINVSSKSFTPNTTFKVEFSQDSNFTSGKSTFIDAKLENNVLVVDIPSNAFESQYTYYRVVSQQPRLTSNYLNFYLTKKTDIVYTYTFLDANGIYIGFDSYNSTDRQYYYSNLSQVIVNGKDIVSSGDLVGSAWRLPVLKKDTVFNFTKISNSCGNLTINTPSIAINLNDYVFVNFQSKNESVCQGKTVEYSYELSNPSRANNVVMSASIYVYGYEYSEATKSYSGTSQSFGIFNLKYSINQEKKTISITIPSDLNQQIKKLFGSRKINIETLFVRPNAYSNSNQVKVGYQGNSTELKLIPELKLTTPKITLNNPGYTDIPLEFLGGSEISYTLSNGQKGVINHSRLNCSSCQPANGGENTLRVFVDKNTTFRVVSAENECALASISGETNVAINASTSDPILVIDESKIPTTICGGTNIEIPIQKMLNIPANTQLTLYKKYYYYGSGTYTEQLFVTAPVILKSSSSNSYKKVEIWLEGVGKNIKSNVVTINIEYKPNNFYIESQNYTRSYQDNLEIINTVIDRNNQNPYIRIYGYGGNLNFMMNGKKFANTYNTNSFSEYWKPISFQKDTLITFNSASNTCGSVEINKQVKFVKVTSGIYGYDQSEQYFLPNTQCTGSKRIITYNYYGEKPAKDSLTVQLAKYNPYSKVEPLKLSFFDVPTQKNKNDLSYTIPDTLGGYYVYRIKSFNSGQVSNFNYGLYAISQKPQVKLSTHTSKSEVLGIPGAALYLDSNYDKASDFNVVLNDGSSFSSFDFGIRTYIKYDSSYNVEKTNLINDGRYFAPKQNTTYSIKSVFNQCGYGTAEGTATIKVQPAIYNKIKNSEFSSTFCSGDSLTLDLSYIGDFPKDTLMGVYLHTNAKASFNQELVTFKNNPNSLKVKLPQDVNTGYYSIQIRKKSRSKIYNSVSKSDSLTRVNAKLNFDSDFTPLIISTPLNINLSGSTEIFVGESATLITNLLNKDGVDPAISKDTILFIEGMPYYYDLSDGNSYASNRKSIIVSPLKSATYSITSVKNACGVGKSTGSATITVYPKSDKRIESIGYFRNFYYKESNLNYYYDNNYRYCAGSKDSLDIKVYGFDNTTDFSKFKVVLSNKDGLNYSAIKTTKTALVTDTSTFKIVRLWHEIPDNLTTGNNYRIKGISEDESIWSTPLSNPIEIRELATALLTGNASIAMGDKINATVKLTGDAPWLLSVVDKDNKFIYNTIPTKKDSTEKFKNFEPKFINTNEFKLELSTDKSNTYKVTQVYNNCGVGKVLQGEFSVDLVLANENSVNRLIQIYPNPTANQITIDLTSLNENTNIEVLDMNGQLINAQSFNKSQIQQKQNLDFSQHPTGVYFLKIRSDKFLQTYRVVKF